MMLARPLVSALAHGLQSRALRRPMRTFFRRRAPILFYRGVWPAGSPCLGPFGGRTLDGLRDDLKQLSRHFRVVPLDQVLAHNTSREPPEEPVVAIAFDGGHDVIGTGVLDVLAELGVTATLFVITSILGNRRLLWTHRLAAVVHAKGFDALTASFNRVVARRRCGPPLSASTALPIAARSWPVVHKDEIAAEIYAEAGMPPETEILAQAKPYTTWADLRTWMAAGHQVGLQGATGSFCSRLTAADIEAEFVAPSALLRQELDQAPLPTAARRKIPFAYPFGDRLGDPALEATVHARASLSCMLGSGGMSALGTMPWRLERVDATEGLAAGLFARPVMAALARSR